VGHVDPHRDGSWPSYIFVDIAGRDLGGYVADAQAAVAASITPAAGPILWNGAVSFEYLDALSSDLLSCAVDLGVDLFAAFFSLPPHDRER